MRHAAEREGGEPVQFAGAVDVHGGLVGTGDVHLAGRLDDVRGLGPGGRRGVQRIAARVDGGHRAAGAADHIDGVAIGAGLDVMR